MARIEVRIPNADGVAAGQTALFKIPATRRYHDLRLVYTGVTLSQMTEIRVVANEQVIQRFSAADRDVMNQFDGRAAAAGILTIPFDRYFLNTRQADEETALNCGSYDDAGNGISSLTVEIDIAGAATAPVLSMFASASESVPGGPGTIMRVSKYTRTAAGAGELQISDLPYNTPQVLGLNRVWIKPSANDISRIIVERATYNIWERSKSMNERIQTDGVRTPQNGWHVVDKTECGYGGDPIDVTGYSDFRYRLDMTGAASLTVYQEELGVLR